MTVFTKYTHLERIGKGETDGIENGICFVMPKLDGTNASIWFNNGELKTGSRNNELGLGKADNAGFNAYVQENKEKYLPFFNILPNAILYGEWLVPHSVKTYRSDAWRKFYVFDVVLDKGELEYLTPEQYIGVLQTLDIEYVPVICKVENFTGDWADFLPQADFLIDKTIEGAKPEGIVMKNYSFVNKYGRKTFAKLVDTEVMTGAKKANSKVKEAGGLELEIAEKYVTSHMIDKERAKIEGSTANGSIQGRLLQTIFFTLIDEEIWDILKKYKYPTIDFKKLNREVIEIVKAHCKDLF
jgi:hypothetical protein